MENAEKCSDVQELFDRKGEFDHFKNEESDPKDTNAMRSSLWEIDNLRYHYCPPVPRFVLSLENDLAVRSRALEIAVKDFSSGSYATIFNNEIRRRVKQVALAFYKSTPTSLFSESDFPGWTFKFKDAESILTNDNGQAIGVSEDHSGISAKRLRTSRLYGYVYWTVAKKNFDLSFFYHRLCSYHRFSWHKEIHSRRFYHFFTVPL